MSKVRSLYDRAITLVVRPCRKKIRILFLLDIPIHHIFPVICERPHTSQTIIMTWQEYIYIIQVRNFHGRQPNNAYKWLRSAPTKKVDSGSLPLSWVLLVVVAWLWSFLANTMLSDLTPTDLSSQVACDAGSKFRILYHNSSHLAPVYSLFTYTSFLIIKYRMNGSDRSELKTVTSILTIVSFLWS